MLKTITCAALFFSSIAALGGAVSAQAATRPTIAIAAPVEIVPGASLTDADEAPGALAEKKKKKDKKDEDKEEDLRLALELVEPAVLDGLLEVRAAFLR